MSVLDKILGRGNKAPVPVATPEWPELDGQLFIRRLSPAERVEFYALAAAQSANQGAAFQTFRAVYCTVHSDGSRAFDDGDWQALAADPGSGSAVDRLADEADQVNVLSDWARDELKKKYVTTPDSASTSASPAASASASTSS